VSAERGKAEVVVDVREDRIVKTLYFDSETGVPQYDSVARKVYVNLQGQNVLAVIDPASDTVVSQYPVSGCVGNHGMALDPERHLAFLSCEGNDVLPTWSGRWEVALPDFGMSTASMNISAQPATNTWAVSMSCS